MLATPLTSDVKTSRTISHIIEPQHVVDGAGVRLRRAIAPQVSNEYDPFLLFDHFAFRNPREGEPVGFPMHPHRGIETVSYILEGYVNHRDSLGNAGRIGPGDVQWMTSGRGIMHEELPRRGPNGAIQGFQLWVNLPAKLKMTTPRYQDVVAADIPAVELDGATVRVVAGVWNGVQGPVQDIAAQPLYMDVALQPHSSFTIATPHEHTVVAYVFDGAGTFGAEQEYIPALAMVVFEEGDAVVVKSDSGVRFMLMAGAPIREPIFPYGPFVMNTREEIRQTILELQNGTFIR
jgi:redox-sensitive bicupin YhaK (pirin superfamily)